MTKVTLGKQPDPLTLLDVRELITHYSDALRPDYWICNQCGQEFHMSVDDVAPSSHFPPVHTWVEFEQHKCQGHAENAPSKYSELDGF